MTVFSRDTERVSPVPGLSLGGGVSDLASLLDDAGHRFRRFGALADPAIGLLEIESVVHAALQGIIGSDLFDIAAVPAFAAIDRYNLVVGTILGAFACESKNYHVLWSVGRRNLEEFPRFAKEFWMESR